MKLNKNQNVTLINKGITRSEYTNSTWIDERRKGRASPFKITKVGRKYLYGHYIYNHGEEDQSEAYWEDKILMTDFIILDGHQDTPFLRHKAHIKRLDDYDKAREEAVRDIDNQMCIIKNAKVIEWENFHPRPKAFSLRY